VIVDVSGRIVSDQGDPELNARMATMIARSILGRIRVEDRAARIDDFRFAIMAPETDGAGASNFAGGVVDAVRKRLMTLGYESSTFAIAVGWADYPHAAQSSQELLEVAGKGLAASVLANETARPANADEVSPSPSFRTATDA
jgi:hypothetical protein